MSENKIEQSTGQKASSFFSRFANSIVQNRWIAAMLDSFGTYVPLMIIGALGVCMDAVVFADESLLATMFGINDQAWWETLAFYVDPVFVAMNTVTMGFFALFFATSAGYYLSKSYGDPVLYGAIVGAGSFILLNPVDAAGGGVALFGSTGLMMAMIVALIGPTVFHKFVNMRALKLNLPEAVPPAIAGGLAILFPLIITFFLMGLIQPVWGGFMYLIGWGKTTQTTNYLQFDYTGVFTSAISTGNFSAIAGDDLPSGALDLTADSGALYYYVIANGTAGLTAATNINLVFVLNSDNVSGTWYIANDAAMDAMKTAAFTSYSDFQTWFNGLGEADLNNFSTIDNIYAQSFMDQIIADNTGYAYLQLSGDVINSAVGLTNQHYIDKVFNVVSEDVVNGDYYYIFNGLNQILFSPFESLGRTWWATSIICGATAAFYVIGAHGPSIMQPITAPLWVAADVHNMQVFADLGADAFETTGEVGGLIAFSMTSVVCFIAIGGTGFSFAAIIAAALFSKDAGQREIGKVAFIPCMFEVNEPFTFGLPIVFQPIYLIPQMGVPMITAIVTFCFQTWGWVNPIVVAVPWVLPFPFQGILATMDWRALILLAINVVIGLAIWIPWIIWASGIIVRKQVKESGLTYEEWFTNSVDNEQEAIVWRKSEKQINKISYAFDNKLEKLESKLAKAAEAGKADLVKSYENEISNLKSQFDADIKEAEKIKVQIISDLEPKMAERREKKLRKIEKDAEAYNKWASKHNN